MTKRLVKWYSSAVGYKTFPVPAVHSKFARATIDCLGSLLLKLLPGEYSVRAEIRKQRDAEIAEKELLKSELRKRRDEEISETEILKLEECPKGYARTAAFLSSETTFSLYRGFNYLYSRVLLNLQDEIVELERNLKSVEVVQEANNLTVRLESRQKDVRAPQNETGKSKSAIMSELESKLMIYGKILKRAKDIRSFQKPSKRDYKSVRSWFWNETPLVQKERQFIKHKEDIVTLHNGREWSAFDEVVEKFLLSLKFSFVRAMFQTEELRKKTDDKAVRFVSRSRVEFFVGLIITSLIFVLLVVPVVVMYKMTAVSRGEHAVFTAIGVLIIFTTLFSAAMGLLTAAKRHEVFAASAAYCAVLVVFISNFSS
ncbi:MAG: hypothetical protein M1820_002623 [Bogoriella megaspora]|nr:MAG: hypothetical protein M1820_002623 [Bogoriella megaspora]